jgi:uncharacterized protein YqeY
MICMDTKAQLENSLKDALRSGDELRKRTIRMAISEARLAEINQGKPLEEADMIAILQKEVKSRNEAIADAQRAGRSDLVAAAQDEIGVLETFLPKQFTPQELEALARQAIDEAQASSPGDMGKVMKLLSPRLQGRATGAQASQIVRQLLGG